MSPDVTIPEITAELRSSAMAVAGTFTIGLICGLVVLRALMEREAYGSPGAAATGVLGAVAVFVSVLRWTPSLQEDSVRAVPRRHAAMLLAASVSIAAVAITVTQWRDGIVGVLSTVCLLNVYLACWGYRSLFLLRRITLFSVLSWPVVATALHDFVGASLTAPSDLVYRRLSSFNIASATDHPWRVYQAMTGHATVAVVGVVILTLAASRLRLSVAAIGRLVIGTTIALIVHHAVVLSAAIESYEPSWWAMAATSPVLELVVAGLVATALFSTASALTSNEHATIPSPDRDPEIFGVHHTVRPVVSMRVVGLVMPAALMIIAVMRP
jgi:hypothetical protein